MSARNQLRFVFGLMGLFALMAFASASGLDPGPVPVSIGSDSSPAQQLELGQAIYAERCEICHGAEGDANTPAALNMDPRPRDFRRGWYKVRTTASGQLPTDEDLFNVIAEGMPGTTMPGWKTVLTADEMRAVAQYIKSFSRRFEREQPTMVEVGLKVNSSQESIARGREIFMGQEAECVKCHGLAGRGDGPSARELTEDFFGDAIVPADLNMPWLFRGGPSVDDIYMRLKTGMTGSPMPSYADVLSDEDLWHLANYVDSLAPDAPPELEAAILATRVEGSIPDDPDAEAWQNAQEYYYPLIGQIMREPRNYTPSVGGVWVRALYNEQEIALLVCWHDRFQDAGQGGTPPDGFAVQYPAELAQSDERPYFVFGDSANPVNLWFWSVDTGTVEERNARGPGTDVPQATQNLRGAGTFVDGEFRLIVRRDAETTDAEDVQFETGRFIPIAFAAWDGWQAETIQTGAISSWFLIYLEEPVPVVNYIWIPVAIALTALIEIGVVWNARRNAGVRGSTDNNSV
jgi:DMSO reductase family type II enzyme heme b subunit